MNRALPPALLLLGLLASVASSVPPALEEYSNNNIDKGPILDLGPGEVARFRMWVEAPAPAAGAVLSVEALRLEEPADSGVDSATTEDTGRDTGFGEEFVGLELALTQRDAVLASGGPDGRGRHLTVRATLFDVFGGCLGTSAGVSTGTGEEGSCTVELDVTLTNVSSSATRVIWGTSIDQESTWQPCDEDGEPADCRDEAPPSDVKVRIQSLL